MLIDWNLKNNLRINNDFLEFSEGTAGNIGPPAVAESVEENHRIILPDKIIIAADTMRGEIVIKGWSENSALEISVYITQCKVYGLNNFLITDIDKDGMLEGPNFRLYQNLKEIFPDIYIIASGGMSNMDDLIQLDKLKCSAAVVGKAIYENKISLKELAEFGK